MNELVDTIRAAIDAAASAEVRAAGAAACRTLLATLEPPQTLVSPDALAQLASVLRGMNVDQLLDVAIAKLRTLEAGRAPVAPAAPARPFTIQMVPLPASRRSA